jgi:hypothetical protein
MEEEGYRLRYSGNLVFLWLKTRGTESRLEFGVIYFAGGDIFAGTTPKCEVFRLFCKMTRFFAMEPTTLIRN